MPFPLQQHEYNSWENNSKCFNNAFLNDIKNKNLQGVQE